jgi:hypothetical protein
MKTLDMGLMDLGKVSLTETLAHKLDIDKLEETKIYVIYKHTSPSGKSYIGQTSNYQLRNKAHVSPHSQCVVFKHAIQKYGWEAFVHEILMVDLTIEDANIFEQKLILEHNTLHPKGYNLKTGGLNGNLSENTKLKISLANSGRMRLKEENIKRFESIKKTNIEKFGTKTFMHTDEWLLQKEKYLKKLNVSNVMHDPTIRANHLLKVNSAKVSEKRNANQKQKNLEKYSVENVMFVADIKHKHKTIMNTSEVKQKRQLTIFEKYGVEHISQLKVKCNRCNKNVSYITSKKYHFDNCKSEQK